MTNLRLSYQTVEFDKLDIHLCTLRNNQEFYDPNGLAESLGISSASWPLFGILWPSSLVLAHHMFVHDTQSKRILEVGCGMALASLLLNKQQADITATDYHPEVQTFLNRNTHLNNSKDIAFERVGWADGTDSLGLFDIIIGSDLLYEDEHIELLATFISSHANTQCEVIIVDPGRGRKNKLAKLMTTFGFIASQEKPDNTDYLSKEFKGHILTFKRGF
ncbi:class I SAM-dependent methyltransferase [Shewanella aestuarii]|uniref:Histidine kinase n=1 Tax=Shewanella aestuarii TaxID=1028752 RepID=A0A6G9QKB2_9GAMM|nr:methyltransferase domain-containing protein [Shewanella aestuarii]QIR14505.1 histidine kinase [Shewanella aestuarii]